MATIDYMVASYGPYSASATGGNALARDFLAGIAAMYSTPSKSASPLFRGPTLTRTSVLKHGQVQSPRVGINIPRLHGYPVHYPHLRFLLERPNYPGEVQIRAGARQRQEEQ